MAVQLPPLRTLQDFLTDAQFTAPTLHDRDRMENRVLNNLIYYQTNYFLTAIIAFLAVGTLYPKDMLMGALSLVLATVLYSIATSREPKLAKLKKQHPSLAPLAVIGLAVLLMFVFGSILVFTWGVNMPLAVILLHASTRKRNLKNKFANMVDLIKEDVSPMTIILSKICPVEEGREEQGK